MNDFSLAIEPMERAVGTYREATIGPEGQRDLRVFDIGFDSGSKTGIGIERKRL